jgi:hypothetical protein
MRWELGWRGRRWKLIILVAGVCSGWGVIKFHGIRVMHGDGVSKVGNRCSMWKQ